MTTNRTTGAFRTFYHFRRTMSNRAALKAVKSLIRQPRQTLSPDPLCVETRQVMVEYYDKPYQGD